MLYFVNCLIVCLVVDLMFNVVCLCGCLVDVWLDDSVMFAISLARPSPPAPFYPKPEIYVARCLCRRLPNVINDFHSLNHKRKTDSRDRKRETT